MIANKTKSVSEDNCGGTINCEQNYIGSLQERISSLERELEHKQNIIELLDVNKLRIDHIADMKCPWKRSRFNFGTQKSKDSWNVEHPEVDLKKGEQKSFGKACTTVPENNQHKKTKEQEKGERTLKLYS